MHNVIKRLRQEGKLTQSELANRMGVHQATISMWETGERRPPSDKLPELAKHLGVEVGDLFGAKEASYCVMGKRQMIQTANRQAIPLWPQWRHFVLKNRLLSPQKPPAHFWTKKSC